MQEPGDDDDNNEEDEEGVEEEGLTSSVTRFLSFGNRTQNSRVAGARPNHQSER